MFGTVTLQADSIIIWLMVIMMAAGLLFIIRKNEERNRRRLAEKAAEQKAEHEAHRLQQLRDEQLNHGRQVFNWLAPQMEEYRDLGIRIDKIEENGEKFSIFVGREDDRVGVYGGPGYPGHPILQLSYHFVRDQIPRGSVHYGAYGDMVDFNAYQHSPYENLHRLVLKEVQEYAARRCNPVGSA